MAPHLSTAGSLTRKVSILMELISTKEVLELLGKRANGKLTDHAWLDSYIQRNYKCCKPDEFQEESRPYFLKLYFKDGDPKVEEETWGESWGSLLYSTRLVGKPFLDKREVILLKNLFDHFDYFKKDGKRYIPFRNRVRDCIMYCMEDARDHELLDVSFDEFKEHPAIISRLSQLEETKFWMSKNHRGATACPHYQEFYDKNKHLYAEYAKKVRRRTIDSL